VISRTAETTRVRDPLIVHLFSNIMPSRNPSFFSLHRYRLLICNNVWKVSIETSFDKWEFFRQPLQWKLSIAQRTPLRVLLSIAFVQSPVALPWKDVILPLFLPLRGDLRGRPSKRMNRGIGLIRLYSMNYPIPSRIGAREAAALLRSPRTFDRGYTESFNVLYSRIAIDVIPRDDYFEWNSRISSGQIKGRHYKFMR